MEMTFKAKELIKSPQVNIDSECTQTNPREFKYLRKRKKRKKKQSDEKWTFSALGGKKSRRLEFPKRLTYAFQEGTIEIWGNLLPIAPIFQGNEKSHQGRMWRGGGAVGVLQGEVERWKIRLKKTCKYTGCLFFLGPIWDLRSVGHAPFFQYMESVCI